jgi:hypothetical protein
MFTISTAVIIFIIVVALLFIGRRVFRLALKLAVAGILVLLLLAGGAYGWWQGWFGSTARTTHPAPSNQRVNANRRPAR